ncbi:MAG: AAA family ATPase [Sterolibacterium sp.]
MTAVVKAMYEPDQIAMRQHVEHLFGGCLDGCQDGKIELAWTDTRPDTTGRYRLKNARLYGTDEIEALVEEAARLNGFNNCNVYIGAALRKPDAAPFGRAQDSDAMALTCAYVDLDDPGAAGAAKDIYGLDKPTFIVLTGRAPHVRAQMWWRLEEPTQNTKWWPGLLRGIAAKMGGDSTVTNPSRVMRLAGSIAWPVKPGRTVELTSIAPLREPGPSVYALDHLAMTFPPVGESTATAIPASVTHTTNGLGLADKIMDGREAYMRDTITACLVEIIGTTGAAPSPQELFNTAWPQYERKVDLGRPGRGAEEFAEKCEYTIRRFERGEIRGVETLDAAVASYARKERAKAEAGISPQQIVGPVATPQPGRFKFETVSDLRTLPETAWLAKDWVPAGGTGIFYGKWAAGKSFIGFDFALHLAYGFKDWHGVDLPGEETYVLVIAREGHHGFVKRIDAFKKHHGITDDTTRIVFMRASVSFMREDDFNGLLAAIAALGIRFKLVLVDTVARVLPGVDMNEQQTITLFMERISVLGAVTDAATIGVHHQNKSGGMMGSTFFEANADFVFEISRIGDDEGPLSAGEILCTKMKDGEDRWKRSVKYKKVELSIVPEGPTSLVVESIHAGQRAQAADIWPDRDVCQRVLNMIHEEWCKGTPLSVARNVKDTGRYAPAVIARNFEIKEKVALWMVRQWLQVRPEPVLRIEMVDKKTKQMGLQMVGSIRD